MYLFECNGKPSATKTMLIVLGTLTILRWAMGGISIVDPTTGIAIYTISQISGLDVTGILTALSFARGYSSSTLKDNSKKGE